MSAIAPEPPVPAVPQPVPAAPAPAPVVPEVKSDKGFPEETPLEQMTDGQQAAYWRHYARKHEDNTKTLAAENAALKPKAEQYDQLEAASRTDQERAVEAAKAEGRSEAAREFGQELVKAQFKIAAATRIDEARLNTIIEDYDLGKFLNDDGTVNKASVAAKVDAIAPAQAPAAQNYGDFGQGYRGTPTTPSVASGQALYEQKKNK